MTTVPGRMNLRMSASMVSGTILGFLGAALDFYSGYLLLAQENTTNDMGIAVANPYALAWGAGVSILGVAVLATSIFSLSAAGARRMGGVGVLMVAFGAAMLVVGASMYGGAAPMIQGATLAGAGMLVVGVLMAVNGAIMARRRQKM
jgi:hypothetical protein